ncbi:glycoside hydrolase family 3 N-terminal domain-containing protein [Rapidithrix thailandica]|uniref:Glycoside hydrolase family 3 N-terminal domain-containing protein n=1 Tax=Rapidithrix thailandica TaxID=413964 RepID=A0AAW9S817_9BACT
MKKTTIFCLLGLLISTLLLPTSCTQTTQLDQTEVKKKVGQLFLLAFTGSEADVVLPFVRERGIGGLYLSNDNLKEPTQTAKLLNTLQAAAVEGISQQPLLTAADQEGAWGIMVPYSTTGPGNMALGAAPVENTEKMYSIFSQELAAVGVFCNLSPVADVNSNPLNPIIGTRSFGEDVQKVTDRVKASVSSLQRNGIISTAKHFPGHGNTHSDSHSGIPHVDRSLHEIESIDLAPFKAAVEAGVEIVMTAHIIYDSLDTENPATLSPEILNGYLRKKLGFKGVIITDSFNMGAIQKNYDPAEAAVAAILAGADMIMLAEERYGEDVGDYVKSQHRMIDRVEQAVLNGEISMERLDEAYNRIVTLKEKYQLAQKIPVDVEVAASIVGSPENKEAAIKVAEAALHIAYDNQSLLPLKPDSEISVVRLTKEDVESIVKISEGIGPNYYTAYTDFVTALKEEGFQVSEYSYDEALPEKNVVICVSENYPFPGKSLDLEEQRNRLSFVQEQNGAPVINVALKDPYDAYLVSPDAYVSAMGSNISNVKAMARLLVGKTEANGTLPVSPIAIEN